MLQHLCTMARHTMLCGCPYLSYTPKTGYRWWKTAHFLHSARCAPLEDLPAPVFNSTFQLPWHYPRGYHTLIHNRHHSHLACPLWGLRLLSWGFRNMGLLSWYPPSVDGPLPIGQNARGDCAAEDAGLQTACRLAYMPRFQVGVLVSSTLMQCKTQRTEVAHHRVWPQTFGFLHPPVLSSAPIGERNHGHATIYNGVAYWSVWGVS